MNALVYASTISFLDDIIFGAKLQTDIGWFHKKKIFG